MSTQTHRSPPPRRTGSEICLAAALVLLLAFISPAPAAHAATVDVCPTGGSYATLQAALRPPSPISP